jgi:hypothetical protein
MKKVEIGDIVRANKLSLVYRSTTLENKWVGRVTAVNEDGSFKAKTIESALDNYGQCYFDLDPRYFDLVKRLKKDCVLVSNQATILFDEDGKKHVSKCSNEEFDLEKGIMMCICKKHGYTYEDIRRLLKNVEFKEVKEKKRRALVGEYIKIVSPEMSGGYYEKDDILKVERVCPSEVYCEGKKIHILHSEYVVLVGYKPE